MKRITAFCMLSFLLVSGAAAQTDFELDSSIPAGGFYSVNSGVGNTYYFAPRFFNQDSSHVEFMECDAQKNVLNATAIRFAIPFSSYNGIAKLNSSLLLAGTNIGFDNYPFLLNTDLQGNVNWSLQFNSLDHAQGQTIALNTNGDDFSVYTYAGGFFQSGFYRFDGDATNGPSTGLEMGMNSVTDIRVYTATPTLDPDVHIVAGEIDKFNEHFVSLAEVSSTAVGWFNSYDMGSTATNEIEEVNNVIRSADGNYLCVGARYDSASVFRGFVMKFDPAGAVLWAKTYSNTSGLLLSDIYELNNGELLLSGTNQLQEGQLIRINPTGDIIWAKQHASAISRLFGFRLDGQGELKVKMNKGSELSLSLMGEGCDLSLIQSVTSDPISVSVSPEFMNDNPVPPSVNSLATFVRPPVRSWNALCIVNSIDEGVKGPSLTLTPLPNPSKGLFRFGDDERLYGAHMSITDMRGLLVREESYTGEVDLRAFSKGFYLVRFPAFSMHAKVHVE